MGRWVSKVRASEFGRRAGWPVAANAVDGCRCKRIAQQWAFISSLSHPTAIYGISSELSWASSCWSVEPCRVMAPPRQALRLCSPRLLGTGRTGGHAHPTALAQGQVDLGYHLMRPRLHQFDGTGRADFHAQPAGCAAGDCGSSPGPSGRRRLAPRRSYRPIGGRPGSQPPPVWPRPRR